MTGAYMRPVPGRSRDAGRFSRGEGEISSPPPRREEASPYLFFADFLTAFFAGFFAGFLATFFAVFFTVFFTATFAPLIIQE